MKRIGVIGLLCLTLVGCDQERAYTYQSDGKECRIKLETVNDSTWEVQHYIGDSLTDVWTLCDSVYQFDCGDLTGDGRPEILVGVIRATRYRPEPDKRLFIFKLFKGMFARILMMGVSPVTMDDVTSGFNIASNISLRPEFNMMLGFSEEDVRQMIRYYQSVGMLDGKNEEALVEEMKPWYNNYCFARDAVDTDPKMFNCDMVLYYLNRVMQTGKSPYEMIDPNTKTDYAKMRRLIQIDALDNYRRNIIHEVTEKGFLFAELKESFDASRLIDRENFIRPSVIMPTRLAVGSWPLALGSFSTTIPTPSLPLVTISIASDS